MAGRDTLHQGQIFKDWDELISSNRVFIFKFFSFGTMVSPYLGIFYNANNNIIRNGDQDSSPDKAVWVANKNNPIPDVYGNLKIDVNGKLSILSSEVTVLDLFSPSQVTRNASVRLLDSGNLVVQELYPDGSIKEVLWQSFDYPTDTLLPGMKLGTNLKTGHRWSLTSWRNSELPADGSFTLTGDLNGTGQMVILRQKNVYWKSGPWQNGRFKNKKMNSGPDVRLYYVSNETEESFTYITKTYDSFPALTMLQNGHLESRTLNFQVYCPSIDNPPGCAEDELEKLKCRERSYFEEDRYHWYVYVDEYVYNESYNLNSYDCKKICWGNCSCVAYTDVTGDGVGCKTYGKRIWNPDKADKVGYYLTIKQNLEIKTEEEKKMNKKKKKLWIGLIVMIIPLVVFLSCYLVYKKLDVRGKAKNIQKLLLLQTRRFYNYVVQTIYNNVAQTIYNNVHTNKNVNAEVHYFTFQSISSATNNFSSTNKLGEGGFGEVYKGKLADGQEVAVKRLSRSSGQGDTEFKNEIELIAKLQHTNLVRLVGCCIEKKEKILVYEYMPNNSLDFFLFDQTKKGLLDWNSRIVIIDGIAQGLLYLHRFSRLRIIHRDLKASNILLDDYLKPKISDFGLAKLFGINESEENTSRVVGTRGYMSPEYLMEGTVSTKIDVFGFGVLLLEIISGKMNHGSYDTKHPLNLLGLAWELWNEGRGLELMDQTKHVRSHFYAY
uniref:Receptor-like serine/threonine-protein kinase n=1 Tax=Tanacetum cinerariifolium TaxID=118510 RepID=A0A6L2J674_TANCI|nr:G-type lectin S-receptor-like serine/threonine-protein kinase CES101 [Tanacetum cinerariifolium]